MTDSRQLFIKVKLWFKQLMNLDVCEQEEKLHELLVKKTLTHEQLKLLSDMLIADNIRKLKKTQLAKSKSISENR